MSSPNLTMIKKDGKILLAHFYSFRGYPENVGLYYLHLLRRDGGLKLKEMLCHYQFMDESIYNQYCKYGFILDEEALCRDHPTFVLGGGDEVIERMLSGKETTSLNMIKLAYTGDLCWAYLIDYDKSTYEVYKGFNHTPLDANELFYNDGKKIDSLYPIKMRKAYYFDTLPTDESFLIDMDLDLDDEDEEEDEVIRHRRN